MLTSFVALGMVKERRRIRKAIAAHLRTVRDVAERFHSLSPIRADLVDAVRAIEAVTRAPRKVRK